MEYENALNLLTADVRSDQSAFFVGAGVSMLPPSNLPSGQGLKHECLSALSSRYASLRSLLSRLEGNPRYASITPELVFQPLFEVLQQKMESFFEYLRSSAHNQGHAVLAYLASSAHQPTLTTNFDTLIEASGAQTKVLHLHGDLDHHAELVFRINQVGKGLDPRLRARLLGSVSNRTLYVLGYSGADRDIIKALRDCKCNRVIWFIHPLTRDRSLQIVESLSLKQQVQFVPIDLKVLFRDLSQKFSVGQALPLPRQTCLRDRVLSTWGASISRAEAWACIGRVLLVLELYEESKDVMVAGIRHGNPDIRACWFLNEAANAMKLAGRFDQALHYARRALQTNSEPTDWALRAGSLNLVGLAYLEQLHPHPKRALQYFRQAKSAAMRSLRFSPGDALMRSRLSGFLARLYNNMGLANQQLHRNGMSVNFYKRSIRIKSQTGDLLGIGRTAANICLAYYERRQFARSSYWRKRALEIIIKYEQKFDQAFLFRRLGEISCKQGRGARGLKLLDRALAIYENNADLVFGVELTRAEIAACMRRNQR